MTISNTFPISPPLHLPPGQTEESIKAFFASIELEGAPKAEMVNYWTQDWKRFIYTLGLAVDKTGECLELGSNPHYTTLLVRYFSRLNLTLANYFGDHFEASASQLVRFSNPISGIDDEVRLPYLHFNVERDDFPFADGRFDLVLFCEIIEHLQNDPIRVLSEIKRVLKPMGALILTTPNVNRLENVARMIAGANIYDPYSGYGSYGRHNREFNRHELCLLLDHCGFDIEIFFSADVHDNLTGNFVPVADVWPLVAHREPDLGQYLFVRAVNARPAKSKRPAWLFRSYPPGELD